MKIRSIVLPGLILFLLPAYTFSQPSSSQSTAPSSTLGNLRLSLLDGDVQIKTVDTGDWAPASINEPLQEGDELWAPEAGKLEVQVMPATYVRLDQNSSLAVNAAGGRPLFRHATAPGRHPKPIGLLR